MAIQSGPSAGRVLILLAPGFEEGIVVYCLDRMRESGISVSLVSLSAGLVNSLHGLSIRPDCSLDQLIIETPYRLIIVPGGRQCVSSLLADPRVHHLLEATLKSKGLVAATPTAAPVLAQATVSLTLNGDQFISQADMEVTEFSSRLINLVLG